MADMDLLLHQYLCDLYAEKKKFPQEIKSVEDIVVRFSVNRSLRRASDFRVLNKKVSTSDVHIVNRWKTIEAAQGKRPGRSMRQHYAKFSSLKQPFLRYTFAM